MEEILGKKMFEKDYERAEKKLHLRIEEKINECKEKQRVDRNELVNKLAAFRAEVSDMTFDKPVHNFLKNQVYNEWKEVVTRTCTNETGIEMSRKREMRLAKKLNQSLDALKIGRVDMDHDFFGEETQLNEDSSEQEDLKEKDISEDAANIEVSRLSKSRTRSKGTSSNNKVVPSLKSLKSVRDSNTNIGKSTVSPTSQ